MVVQFRSSSWAMDPDEAAGKRRAPVAFYGQKSKSSSDDLTLKPEKQHQQQEKQQRLETLVEVDSEAELSTMFTIGELLARKGVYPRTRERAAANPKRISHRSTHHRRTSSRDAHTRPTQKQQKISAAVEVEHNFQSKYCFKCGRLPFIFLKKRCLVCGKLYCWICIKTAMGDMLEGPKCIDCLGHRVNKRYKQRKAATGCLIQLLRRSTQTSTTRGSPTTTSRTVSMVGRGFRL